MAVHFAPQLRYEMQSRCTVHFFNLFFALLWHVVHTWRNSPVYHMRHCVHLPYTHYKHSAPVSELILYTLSALSRAFTVYTIKCTNSVHCMCTVTLCSYSVLPWTVDRWVHLLSTLYIHSAPVGTYSVNCTGDFTDSVQCRCTVHLWVQLQFYDSDSVMNRNRNTTCDWIVYSAMT